MFIEKEGILSYHCPQCEGKMFYFVPTACNFTIIQPTQIAIMENIKPILEQTATSAQTYCEKCQPDVLLTEIETLLTENFDHLL